MIIDEILEELQDDINQLLNHDFIKALEEGKLSKKDLIVFGEQYFLISQAFNSFLFFACGNINKEELNLPLLENLYDEYGRGNLAYSHKALFKNFLLALNIIDLDSIFPLSSTSANIYGMQNLCIKGSSLEVLGALGPGCESFTVTQYTKIQNALIKYFDFSVEELIFFTEHIGHDDQHSDDISKILEHKIKSEKDKKLVVLGAKQAIAFESLFWDGIYKEIIKSK